MSTTTIKPVTKLADGKEIRPETVLADGQVLTREIHLQK